MTISCKEVTRLVSQGLDRDLGFKEQVRLRAHFVICRGCRSVNERMAFLRRAVGRIVSRDDPGNS